MAIFGPFVVARAQLAGDPRFAAGLRYVEELLQPGSAAHRRLQAAAAGANHRVELAGGAFALENAYLTRLRSETFFESHRRFIDIQVVLEGAEVIEVEPIDRLQVDVPYDAERDLAKYGDTPAASQLALRAGDAAVFFPADGHRPTLQYAGRPVLVRKSVVKVPVAPS